MPDFTYIARTVTGDRASGVIEADTEAAVLRILDERRLLPVEVSRRRDRSREQRSSRVRSRDLGMFYGQLGDLLGSGVPLLRALRSIMRSSVSRRLRDLLREVHDAVADGKELHEAMRDHPETFPLLHVAMVQAGERASFLEEVLSSLADFIERLDDLRGKVRGALIYPALLTLLGTSIMLGALVFFVPRFEPLLEGVDKPLPTTVVFGLSTLVRSYWPLLLVGAVAAGLGVGVALRSGAGRSLFERVRLRVPVVGPALRMVAIARFCRILGTMIANGVPLLQALSISKDATGSRLLAARVAEAAESVRAGETLSGPLGQGDFIPPQVLAMITVAEESNQLQKVLVQIADTVDRRTHRQVDHAVRLVEPVILCLLAVAIGFLAMGLLLPIFTLAGSLGN